MNSSKIMLRFLLIVVFCFSLKIQAQTQYTLKQFGDESYRFVQQPIHWQADDWGKLGIVAASTFLLTQLDQPVRDAVLKNNNNYYHSAPVEFGRMWGEIYPTAIIGGGFGLYGLLSENNSSKRIGYEIYQTAFYAGVITTVLKAAIGRARPFTNKGAGFFKSFSLFDDDFHALPSGHATLAFALSTVLAENTKSDYLKILAYAPAVLTLFSRVYQDKHWTSDVFLGASIGYFVGRWVHNQHDIPENVSIFPAQTTLISIRF